jgi:hypothetical protein
MADHVRTLLRQTDGPRCHWCGSKGTTSIIDRTEKWLEISCSWCHVVHLEPRLGVARGSG